MTKIVFFGTPEFVLPIPQALYKTPNCQLSAIITNPDRLVGRKQILTPSPVKTWAQKHQIPVLTPEKLDTNSQSLITNYQPDLGILAAYGKIIPQEVINLFPKGILVIHPSLLPKYRGASPVQAALSAGDSQTGVTIIKMDEKVDHGPIVAQFKKSIKPGDTSESLLARLFTQAAETLVTLLPAYIEGRIKPRGQNHKRATYSKILKREDGYIDLENPCLPAGRHLTPEVFERMIRAYYPWPGVWSRLTIRSHLVQGVTLQQKIVKFLPENKIQVEGGKPMAIKDFLNGYPEARERLAKLYPLTSS